MSRLKIGEYKMSNKLIKSKSKYDKELEYYKKHSILLEKENIDLKNRNDEILISFAIKNPSEAYDNLSLLIEKTRISMPLNVLGQICLPFTLIWCILSLVAIILDDYIRFWFFNEEKPNYKLF